MSVAHSTRVEPLLNASRLRSRAFWLRLPCRSTAGTPPAVSCLASFLAWCLVRVNSTARSSPEASSLTTWLLSSGVDPEHVVGHRGDRRDGRVDRVRGGPVQVPLDQHVDAVVQGGGEQQPLADLRGPVHQPLHAGQEAQVGHVVGLVEDGDLDGGQVAVPLPDQVLQPAGTGDEHVDAAGEGLHLRVLPDPTEDRGGAHAQRAGQRVDDGRHLVGQLTGRHQDQRTGLARLPADRGGGEPGDQREREGQRLARAGAPAAQHVPAGQRVRQRRDLDRERLGDAAGGEHLHQRGGHAQRGEAGGHRGLDRGRLGARLPDRLLGPRVRLRDRRLRGRSRCRGRHRLGVGATGAPTASTAAAPTGAGLARHLPAGGLVRADQRLGRSGGAAGRTGGAAAGAVTGGGRDRLVRGQGRGPHRVVATVRRLGGATGGGTSGPHRPVGRRVAGAPPWRCLCADVESTCSRMSGGGAGPLTVPRRPRASARGAARAWSHLRGALPGEPPSCGPRWVGTVRSRNANDL